MAADLGRDSLINEVRENLDLTLSACLRILQQRVGLSVFQMAIIAEVDPSAFNKIHSGTERRFLNHEQIERLIHGLVFDNLLPPYNFDDKSNETRIWLMALQAVASAEAQLSMITQRNFRATPDDLRKARHRIVEALRDVWDETESALPAIDNSWSSISLKWLALPSDLYLHVYVETELAKTHISYRSRGDLLLFPFAALDRDCQTGSGPESVTIGRFLEGRYFCFVHNYSGERPLRGSGALVELHIRFYGPRTFECPAHGDGNCWLVFSFDTRAGGHIEEFDKLLDWSPRDETPFASFYGPLRGSRSGNASG